ncbi:SRPBCC domain-containing protein [Streptomyces sp. NRRL B-3648]|uniref:SRPBCC domain-containing protein n=1 Tax=Streptomyces sp. NRRL B-3648 TaxID=1519493 RepID=UPI0006AE1280|nr:SRPBCC domain-containing protein [Streptomyces sp. NRRL B-3648]KOV96238.1 polyketide cyclase [Streptomyces sp. NRRL B-3648]
MHTTRVTRHVKAPPHAVYRALTDPEAVAAWRVPAGMTARVHTFDAREGGAFRISLTYDDPARAGKSGGRTDTYRGHFARLVPGALVVEVLAFETGDDTLLPTMTMTTTLTGAGDGTDVEIRHEGVPDAIAPRDNEQGTRMALDNLARLVEGRRASAPEMTEKNSSAGGTRQGETRS